MTNFLFEVVQSSWKVIMTFSRKKTKTKKENWRGGGVLHPEGGYNRVYFFVADGIITGGAKKQQFMVWSNELQQHYNQECGN